MSDDINNDADDLFGDSVAPGGEAVEPKESQPDEVGLTSDEVDSGESADQKSLLGSLTVFDAMLMVSLLCVTLATLLLFFELRDFGDFPSEFPWRTDEITQTQ